MSRTPDDRRRSKLLDSAVEYILKHGLSDLSLRPLAEALDSSPRVLLYYFGSKEDLVSEILQRAGARQRELFARLRTQHLGSDEACRAIWEIMSAPASEPVFRLFFEVYGLALQDRKRYARFLARVVNEWLEFIAAPLIGQGWNSRDARAYATVVIAGFRGFLLDLCATRDRDRVNAGVTLWLQSLDAITAERHAAS